MSTGRALWSFLSSAFLWFPSSISVGEGGTEAQHRGPFECKEHGLQCSAKYKLQRYNSPLISKFSASSILFHITLVSNMMQTCSLGECGGHTTELLIVLKTYQNYIAPICCYDTVNDCVRLKTIEPSSLCKQNFLTELAVVLSPP